MFKLYKPFTMLTPAQQTSARELAVICEWPEYEIRYKHVYILKGDFVLAAYPMNDYLNEFGIDCPECKGELSISECYESARKAAETAGMDINGRQFQDKLRVIHQAHCKGCSECLS